MKLQSTRLLTDSHKEFLRGLKSVIFDVDGVLTDDTILVGPKGMEYKRFHVSDGLGIALMKKRLRVKVAIVSGRESVATTTRAGELGIKPCLQGAHDKRKAVRSVLRAHKVSKRHAAFVGNEILDLGAFSEVGFKVAVADSAPELAQAADLILKRCGGKGAARELFELICHARGVDYAGWF